MGKDRERYSIEQSLAPGRSIFGVCQLLINPQIRSNYLCREKEQYAHIKLPSVTLSSIPVTSITYLLGSSPCSQADARSQHRNSSNLTICISLSTQQVTQYHGDECASAANNDENRNTHVVAQSRVVEKTTREKHRDDCHPSAQRYLTRFQEPLTAKIDVPWQSFECNDEKLRERYKDPCSQKASKLKTTHIRLVTTINNTQRKMQGSKYGTVLCPRA